MKRKFFNVLLFGALLGASTGVFVSCSEDYDNDIADLKAQVNTLSSTLDAVKSDLAGQVETLKSQLETAKAELNAAVENGVAKEVQDRIAAVAALEAKLEAAQALLEEMRASTASASDLEALAGRLNAIDASLGAKIAEVANNFNTVKAELEQAKAELASQMSALKKAQELIDSLTGKVNRLDTDLAGAKSDIAKLLSDISALQKKIEQAIADNAKDIEALKKEMQQLSAKVDSFSGAINQLNVWIAKQLRSLVFAPRCYYYGIEATYITSNDGIAYTLPSVANEKEDERYDYTNTFAPMAEESVALYHMNPSTAVIDPANVRIAEVVDADYSRALADVKLDVITEGVKTKKGDLMVPLKVDNPELLKNIDNDSKVTVFAIEYAYGDTVITSDYVALLAKQVKVLYKIAHTNNAPSLVQGAPMSQDICTSASATEYGHLMQTKAEAKANAAQDACNWKGSIDLKKCVELHKSTNRVEAEDPVDTSVGYTYVFELTSDADSKYAEIDENGVLTPKDLTGKYSSIGKKPLVRVSVKDAVGNVLDYGYILCEIDDNICNYVNVAAVDWSKAGINPTYWFAYQSEAAGAKEIHLNTKTPEDNPDKTPAALPISLKVANTFVGNKIDTQNGLITVTDKDGDPFNLPVNNVKFIFHKDNNGKTYVANKKTYTLKVSTDNLTLNAVCDGTESAIAVLSGNNVDDQIITYQTNDAAKELLNIAGRDNLAGEIEALVGITFTAACDVPVADNPLVARFIRPINVTSSGSPIITDASATKLQTIQLEDLIAYDDWREGQTWKPGYREYYGVQAVEIQGVNDGDNLRMNPDVKTNQDGSWKSLGDVNDAIDLIYHVGTNGAYIEYRNNQAGVNEFQLQIPVSVTYTWGTFTSIITVTVKKTA